MLKKTPILSLIVLIAAMVACKKTTDKVVTPPAVTLTGTWSLAGIDVTQSTTLIGLPVDSTDSVRVVYSDSYPMAAVTGSFVFTSSDSLYVNGLSYSAQPLVTLSEYTWPGNVLDSTATQPIPVSQDSTSFAFPYATVTGKDSISFPQGGIVYPAVVVGIPLTPTGAIYTMSGDTLKMTMLADTTLPGSSYSSQVSYFGANSRLVLKLVKK